MLPEDSALHSQDPLVLSFLRIYPKRPRPTIVDILGELDGLQVFALSALPILLSPPGPEKWFSFHYIVDFKHTKSSERSVVETESISQSSEPSEKESYIQSVHLICRIIMIALTSCANI
jgi:hypothetical protein